MSIPRDFTGSNANGNGNNPPNNGGGGGGIPPHIMSALQRNPMQGSSDDEVLEMLNNYNEKFKSAGPTLFRDAIINQTMAVLIGKDKPNALLVGAAGVGKTKIVEDIAWRLANDDDTIPRNLKGFTIYELPLSNLVAGSGIVGVLEEKVQSVISFASDPDNKVILFIDEVHLIMPKDGGSGTYDKIAQILKPAMSRGEIKVIGATTLQESSALMADPAFNRRFTRLIVDELTRQQTEQILELVLPKYMLHYNNEIHINANLIPDIARIADDFASAGSHRPDTALTLLDRACGEAIIARKQQLRIMKDSDPNIYQALLQSPNTLTKGQITKTAKMIISGNAGPEKLDTDALDTKLERIKGQDEAINEIKKALIRDDKRLFPRKTPLTFLFAGTSGVGKTEITKIVADVLTGIEPITLNMPEYHSAASINRIIGSPAGYVGSTSNQELPFDILESNPYQVILLDEFEKGDASVQKLFMSAFDEGYIKTNSGKLIDFSKSIIIATTNAGYTGKEAGQIGLIKPSSNDAKALVRNRLADKFDLALLNRFQHIMKFNEISKDVYANIVAGIYAKEIKRIKQENSRVTLDDVLATDTLTQLVDESYVPEFGARPAFRTVRDYIEENA